jgi:uncharacterized membrane protein (UPF0182 family)
MRGVDETATTIGNIPANRNNLIGWIAGRGDGEHYGKTVVYDFTTAGEIET